MQDTGHPDADDRRSGGTSGSDTADGAYPATVDQDPTAAWPGVADIPSPQAERVPPWSAQHLSAPSGPSGWFAPGEQALAAQETGSAQPDRGSAPTGNGPHPGWPGMGQADEHPGAGRWGTSGGGHRAWPVRAPEATTGESEEKPTTDPADPPYEGGSPAGSWSPAAETGPEGGWSEPGWHDPSQQPWGAGQQSWTADVPSWPTQQPGGQPGWQPESSAPWQAAGADQQPYPPEPPTDQQTETVQPERTEDRGWEEHPQSWPQPEPQQAWPQRPAPQQSWPPAVWAPGQHQVEPPAQPGPAGWQFPPEGGPPAHAPQPGQHPRPAPPYSQHPEPYAVAQPSSPEAHGYAPPQPAQPLAAPPTAEEFAARRAHRPQAPEATMGVPALVRRVSFGMVSPSPSRKEREHRDAVAKVRRNFGGLRQITVVNPKGGAGKTVAALMVAMTFGQSRGGYVLAWDNNETQGTLGMRAQQDFHVRTVRDVLHDLDTFMGPHGKVGDLSSYVRAQGEAMFDVLASDESATAGEMLTAQAFRAIREVVDRFYKLIIVDTGNNVRAENWQAAIDATNQLVVTMSARGDSAETAARMLDHLEQTGRDRLVRQAVTVVAMPASRKGVDLPAIERHFAARTRAVLVAPYEPLLDSGEPIRYGEISQATRDAWLKIAAHIAEGL